MAQVIRWFLLIEAAIFLFAAALHGGAVVSGYEHREARIAETVIAVVLLGGATVAWMRPARTRTAGLFAQGFALFGTLVGIGTILAGIGPQTALDITIHMTMIAVLIWGLAVAWRSRVVS